jgi:hypothetical protein
MARRKAYKAPARRKATVKRAGKRRGRRRGLSAGPKLPIIGTIGLQNPLIGGLVGAAAGMFIKNLVPDNLFQGKTGAPHPLQPYAKGIILLAGAAIAKNMKQDAIAGGMMAAATVLTLQNLQVPMLSEKPAEWADPSVFLSETAMLSAQNQIYPDYSNMLAETAMLSSRF